MDRLTREFVAIEPADARHEEIENIAVTTFSAGGEPPADVLARLFRIEPHVVVARGLADAELATLLCQAAAKGRLVIGTIRAPDAADALLGLVALGVPAREVARAVTGVVNQRLVRRLCEACKKPFRPPPEVLQQLGIPPDRAVAFHRPPIIHTADKKKPEVCPHCGGVGYRGRVAAYELLVVDDAVRKVLAGGAEAKLLRQAVRKAGPVGLRQAAMLLAARGTTTLDELTRLFG
jgi:type II secretory ATPase GspE/PulE/Tfp pilus assembly ATPase PilB-like protein